MNRILMEEREINGGIAVLDDNRSEHIRNILHGEVGQVLKTGVIDGFIGTSEIVAIEGQKVVLKTNHAIESLKPWADLILAPPRPRILKRLLPQIASLGVGRIILVGAQKVEKDFWGATLLKEEVHRPLLVDGLMQAGTSILPRIDVRRNFRKFLSDELDSLFSTKRRFVAHPSESGFSVAGIPAGRTLLAVGPEGGWTDEEVALLESRDFHRLSLGQRILKTETATIGLLARLMTA